MKDSEREIIKLRANFFNSLSIVFAAAGVITPYYSAMTQLASGLNIGHLLVAIGGAFGAGMCSWEAHREAKRILKSLDEE